MNTRKISKRRLIVSLIESGIVIALAVVAYYIIVLALYVAGVL